MSHVRVLLPHSLPWAVGRNRSRPENNEYVLTGVNYKDVVTCLYCSDAIDDHGD